MPELNSEFGWCFAMRISPFVMLSLLFQSTNSLLLKHSVLRRMNNFSQIAASHTAPDNASVSAKPRVIFVLGGKEFSVVFIISFLFIYINCTLNRARVGQGNSVRESVA